MPHLGLTAVAVGAGIGGLSAAAALQPFYERVVVLERDRMPEDASFRASVPQGKHLHALLAGGQRALYRLLPELEAELAASGAVEMCVASDYHHDVPGHDPYPRRDLGIRTYSMSRPLLEFCIRKCVLAHRNVEIIDSCNVSNFVASELDGRVCGVAYRRNGRNGVIAADLVVDASGRGELSLDLLRQLGQPVPDTTAVGVDIGYGTAVFEIPDDAPPWKRAMIVPVAPASSRGALLCTIEDRRWILAVCARPGDYPVPNPDAYLNYVRNLRTRTIYDAIRAAERVGDIQLFRFPESRWRHYEKLQTFPCGLIPLGDAYCKFNPIYAQGMTVAAQQAAALAHWLGECERANGSTIELARAFFDAASAIVRDAWNTSVVPDFIFPQTRGPRPDNLAHLLQLSAAMSTLAAEDPAVDRVVAEVRHMLKPTGALLQEGVIERALSLIHWNGSAGAAAS